MPTQYTPFVPAGADSFQAPTIERFIRQGLETVRSNATFLERVKTDAAPWLLLQFK